MDVPMVLPDRWMLRRKGSCYAGPMTQLVGLMRSRLQKNSAVRLPVEPLTVLGVVVFGSCLAVLISLSVVYYRMLPDVQRMPRLKTPLSVGALGLRQAALRAVDCPALPGEPDPMGLYQAVWENRQTGCSLISRRLARMFYFTDRQVLPSAFHEALLAVRIEHEFDSDALLSVYLSAVDSLPVLKRPQLLSLASLSGTGLSVPLDLTMKAFLKNDRQHVLSPEAGNVRVERTEKSYVSKSGKKPLNTSAKEKLPVQSQATKGTRLCKKQAIVSEFEPEPMGVSEKPTRWRKTKHWFKKCWRKIKAAWDHLP